MKLKMDFNNRWTILIVVGVVLFGVSGMIYGIRMDQEMQELKLNSEEDISYEEFLEWRQEQKNKDKYGKQKENEEKDKYEVPKWPEESADYWTEWAEDNAEYWSEWVKENGEKWKKWGEENIGDWQDWATSSMKNLKNMMPSDESLSLLSREEVQKIAVDYIEKETGNNVEKCEIDLYFNRWSGWVDQGQWYVSIKLDENTHYSLTVDVKDKNVDNFKIYTRTNENEPWRRKKVNGEIEQIINEKLKDFSKIEVNLVGLIDFDLSEGKDYHIKCHQIGDQYTLKYEVKNDTLYITQKADKSNLKDNYQNDWLYITVPEGSKLSSANINQFSGNVEVANLAIDSADIKVDSGNMSFEDCIVENLKSTVDAGNAFFTGVKIKNGKATNNAGNVFIEDVDASSLNTKVSSGNAFLDGELKGNISINVEAGNIFDECDSNQCKLELDAKYGSVFDD